MARKAKPKIAERAKVLIDNLRARINGMEDNAEGKAYAAFVDATIRQAEAEAALDALGDPPKDEDEFSRRLANVQHQDRVVFAQYDRWRALTKNRVTVPHADIKQIVYDALKVNEAVLMSVTPTTGLDGYRYLQKVAEEIHAEILSLDVKVREESQGTPFCDSCEEEMAA